MHIFTNMAADPHFSHSNSFGKLDNNLKKNPAKSMTPTVPTVLSMVVSILEARLLPSPTPIEEVRKKSCRPYMSDAVRFANDAVSALATVSRIIDSRRADDNNKRSKGLTNKVTSHIPRLIRATLMYQGNLKGQYRERSTTTANRIATIEPVDVTSPLASKDKIKCFA